MGTDRRRLCVYAEVQPRPVSSKVSLSCGIIFLPNQSREAQASVRLLTWGNTAMALNPTIHPFEQPIPAAGNPGQRHIYSDPEERISKKLRRQCQNCLKSELEDGIVLRKCSLCKIERYCVRFRLQCMFYTPNVLLMLCFRETTAKRRPASVS